MNDISSELLKMSFMHIKNSRGPNIELWGIPQLISVLSDTLLFSLTH